MVDDETIIEGYRETNPGKCVSCPFCVFNLSEEERFDREIRPGKEGRCYRYPPGDDGYPVVAILVHWCGEHVTAHGDSTTGESAMTDASTETMDLPIRKYLVPCPTCGKHLSMLMLRGDDVKEEVDGMIVHKPCGSRLKLMMVFIPIEEPVVKAIVELERKDIEPDLPGGYG